MRKTKRIGALCLALALLVALFPPMTPTAKAADVLELVVETDNGVVDQTDAFEAGKSLGLSYYDWAEGWFWATNKSFTLTFAPSVTVISYDAFRNCPGLVSVTIPATVKTIGSNAFSGCENLKSVTIGDGTTAGGNSGTSIGASAFYGCTNLADVDLGQSISTIGPSAFRACESLKSIAVPDLATSIGSMAFYSCTNLTNVTIGTGVSSIGGDAFVWCPSLVDISVANGNESFLSSDSVLYTKDLEKLIACPAKKTGHYTVLDGVIEIESSAFSYCASLTGVTLPDGIKTIRKSAFVYCESMTGINLPDSLESIEENAFLECSSLAGIVIPSSVTVIKDNTFLNCSALTFVTLHDQLTSIGAYAFRGCSLLTDITIPDSVTNIGKESFSYCQSLPAINIPEGLTNIGNTAFYRCESMTMIDVDDDNPAYVDLDGVLYDKAIKTLIQYPGGRPGTCVIPDSVTALSSGAFEYSGNLQTVTMGSGITSIGNNAFQNCSSLEYITIGINVTRIYNSTFSDCTSLKELILPDSVTSLGDFSTLNCDALETISLGKGFSGIGEYVFNYLPSLTNIYVSEDNPEYTDKDGIMLSKDMKTIVAFPGGRTGRYTLLDGVSVVGKRAFQGCRLTEINLHDEVISIGNRSFAECWSLETINLGNSVETIDTHAFANTKKLKEIVLPDSVTTLGPQVFRDCAALESVTLSKNLTEIPGSTFYWCTALKSVVVPDGVTSIGVWAFSCCHSLESILIPRSVTSIAKDACQYSSSVTIYCYSGSAALSFAQHYGIPYAYLDTTYSVFFNKNGGTGTMDQQTLTLDQAEPLNAVAYTYPGYVFDGWNTAADGSGTQYTDGQIVTNLTGGAERFVLYAQWRVAQEFKVSFKKGTGSGSWNTLSKKEGSTVTITAKSVAAFSRKGYVFAHFSGSDGKKYRAGDKIPVTGDLTLTAKYSKVSAPTAAVTNLKLTAPAAKQLKVTYKAVSGAEGYRIEYSTNKGFTKATTKTVHTTKLTYTLKSLSAQKTYFVRVTAYKTDSTKAKIYSKKTATKSLKTK